MTLAFEHEKPSRANEVACLFGYVAAILVVVNTVNYLSTIPDRNAAAALEETVGRQNMNPQGTRLSEEFLAAANARIFPRITARNLPGNYHNSDAVVFSLDGLNGAYPRIPFIITPAFSNLPTAYYTVPDETGHTALVQCNAHQFVRVHIDGMVSPEPITVSEIVNDCHVVGSGTNPLQARQARIQATLFQTPVGLRDEVAKAALPVLRLHPFSQTETRVSITLGDFTQAAADIRTVPHRITNMRLFINGKSHPCDATSTAISTVTLPNRRRVEDMADGFRVRDFVTIRACG